MKIPTKTKVPTKTKKVFLDLNGVEFISQADAEKSNDTIRQTLFVDALTDYFNNFVKPQPNPDEIDPVIEANNKLVQDIMFNLADNLGNYPEGVMNLIDGVFQKIEKMNGVKR